ncbi:serine protease FAM111A-like [Amia ocellicauda]|uniref:serine protease FAM111A-like n=1 Tax=Amia ocellicauda TaxID=2972642 RepID=UPI003463F30E
MCSIVKRLEGQTDLCVFGLAGEPIEDALRADGRFNPAATSESNYLVLKHESEKYQLQFNLPVNTLEDKSYYIELQKPSTPGQGGIRMSSAPQGQSGQSAEALSSTTSTASGRTPGMCFEQRQKAVVKCLKHLFNTGKNPVPYLKEHYRKIRDTGIPTKDLPEITRLSQNVGKIRDEKTSYGTCFLLKNGFILTCWHVVESFWKENALKSDDVVTAAELMQVTFENEEVLKLRVEPCFQVQSRELDFVLLRLKDPVALAGLCPVISDNPGEGPVYIIGHPARGPRQLDCCPVIVDMDKDIAVGSRIRSEASQTAEPEALASFVMFISQDILSVSDQHKLSYATCFFEGASGSPVFNRKLELVAMHTGGSQSFTIEHGTRMSSLFSANVMTFGSCWTHELQWIHLLPDACRTRISAWIDKCDVLKTSVQTVVVTEQFILLSTAVILHFCTYNRFLLLLT